MSGIQLLRITIQNISRTLASSWKGQKKREADDEVLQVLPDALALCLLRQGYLRDSRSLQHLQGALLSCVLEQYAKAWWSTVTAGRETWVRG